MSARRFESATYWEQRYAGGGDSGVGSYGKFSEFKSEVINHFIQEKGIRSVIEFGCGDGNQLSLLDVEEYLGVDVSATAIERCRIAFRNDATKRFLCLHEYNGERAEMSLSLDVIYHLVEDEVYAEYMAMLFDVASRFVLVYSSNHERQEKNGPEHIRHREFVRWVNENRRKWVLLDNIANRYPYQGDYLVGSWSSFFLFGRR